MIDFRPAPTSQNSKPLVLKQYRDLQLFMSCFAAIKLDMQKESTGYFAYGRATPDRG
jgi:hypothetical protein